MSAAALVLAAHGSRHARHVNERIREMADRLRTTRAGREFSTIAVAFHQGEPAFAEVLDALDERDVTVVPVMTSRGYYADHVLPRELARNRNYAQKNVRTTSPVGTHPEVPELVAQRAQVLCREFGLRPAETTVVIAGHGTPRHQRSRRATVNLASQLGYTGDFGQAFAVFLDDAPGVEAVLERACCAAVVVLPFLIGAGPHALDDIPARLGMTGGNDALPRTADAGNRKLVCDRPIGDDDGLIGIITDLATGDQKDDFVTHAQRPLRMGTRTSRLALWQTEHVAHKLRVAGASLDVVELSTLGDRVHDRAIHELAGDAPFCDDIEHALGAGLIDLAVHSLKDVALHVPCEFEIAAVLPRGDAREALVSRNNVTLAALPPGAVVGTSSPRRAAQVRRLRPDLVVQPLRGPVDQRVQQVHDGRFDAAILALAGLQRLGMADAAAEVFSIDDFMPAPAQAALAVEVRAGDDRARRLIRALDDAPTRIATTLELNVLRALEDDAPVAVAAFASVTDEIRLDVRLTALDGTQSWTLGRAGLNPAAVQRAVLAEAREIIAELTAEVRR
ncbi:MAG: hydroxymethylbilane synthase [Phycisphaerales bacterium]|nr:hydroxymethylbilane synthase [Phycisphaerales bacterium]